MADSVMISKVILLKLKQLETSIRLHLMPYNLVSFL